MLPNDDERPANLLGLWTSLKTPRSFWAARCRADTRRH